MTWPARTWVAAELISATIMNAYVRDPITQLRSRSIVVGFGDAAGDVLTTGVKAYIEVPFDCNVIGWTVMANVSGSVVIDVWRDSYANFPPTVADTITGSEKPTLASAQKNQDLALTTWSPAIAQGDILGLNVDSVATIKQVVLNLRVDLT